jgi:lauroyl/myristoyl acyltransferase
MALDLLPWPWGENILAGLFMAVGLGRASWRRSAMTWAVAQRGRHPLRLAAALCAFRGRWVARRHLLGLQDPDELRRHLVVEGEAHLTAIPGAAILLGFHLGVPAAEVTLRVRGHRVTYVGRGDRAPNAGWWRPAWRPFADHDPLAHAGDDRGRWPAVLYVARQILLRGDMVYIMGDGIGTEVFSIPLPGRPVVLRAGSVTLHQLTGARVLPVLTRLDGRTHIVTVHPPLPALDADRARGIEAWREILEPLLADYTRRFPDQCASRFAWGP